uniref:NADH-ubiquinone oxidoreductase chain 4L n=1 Tax=Palinurellus wieneckii TaxID=198231 RepID=S4V3W5_PALWI|nr:NADH dehydrogenase subunit 4L [Palinurellus wieneckii]AGN95860.1 NADH dehydrogenase subunit 4L [Palinurellus wieneckii]
MVILNLLSILVPLVMVFCGLWVFTSKCKHLLNTLLSLEFIMLGIFFVLSSTLSFLGNEVYFILFFLSMVACEGALGLSLLVSIVRTHGNDYYNSFSVLQC